jgi:uncharacterized protein YbjT (DUF2867 family)
MQLLHQAGCNVRALSRHPEKANFPAGVETVAGDLTKPETLQDVWEGVEKAFWVLPQNPDFTFPQTARRHGVRHIVLLSALAVDFGADNVIGQRHRDAEQAVRESGLTWTFLRPGGFMTNTLQWANSIRSEGVVRSPFGDVGSPSIDPRDIAAVAAKALSTDGHEGQSYILTGPESLSARQQAGIIGEVLGRDIRFETIPESVAREHMLRHMATELVDAVFDLSRQGYSTVLPTVEQVTGRAPFTFRQWASDHIEAFR